MLSVRKYNKFKVAFACSEENLINLAQSDHNIKNLERSDTLYLSHLTVINKKSIQINPFMNAALKSC
jgi:hypothetical protein